jgi:hypothetical protein
VGRAALYLDAVPFRAARAEVQLDGDTLLLVMPGGWMRRHALDGVSATTSDGYVASPLGTRGARRFVRMLILERDGDRNVVITPPDLGAVAPNVVRVPEAPAGAAVVDAQAWEALADWMLGGGRLSACSIADLARLACISTPQFAVLIGEIAAQRAIELAAIAAGPWRGGSDVETALIPLVVAAKDSPRAAEALVSALAHTAGVRRRRRR